MIPMAPFIDAKGSDNFILKKGKTNF